MSVSLYYTVKRDYTISKQEQEFDIKYCMTWADKKVDEKGMARMEFSSIEEIADDCHAVHMIQPFYLLTPKTEVMKRCRQALKDRDDIERYRMDCTVLTGLYGKENETV